MIATMAIEVMLAIYVIVRYHMSQALRLIALALGALGIFQLSEYYVCGGLGADASAWSRLGFIAITALPAIGLHLLYVLSGKQSRKLVGVAYVSMAAFMGYFLASSTAFVGHECTGNYVIFQIGNTPALVYGMYYYGWLLTALIIGAQWLLKNKSNKLVRQQVSGLLLGYLVFLVPTGIANAVRPETRNGIPSIMCGFAVLFALILALYIAPKAGRLREKLTLPSFR